MATLMPAPWFTGLDNNGHPVPGGRLYTYLAGTTTPAVTFSDEAGLVPNTNPVILDGAGRASVFVSASSFKFALHDANDVLIREQDFVSAVPANEIDLDVQGIAGESLGDRAVVYLAGGAGGTTPGQWYLTDADSVDTSTGVNIIGIVPQAIGAGASGAIRLQGRVDGFSGLTPGASYFISAVPGEITAVAPPNARFIGIADSTTSLVLTVSGVAQAQPPDPNFNTVTISDTGATALQVAGGIAIDGPIVSANTEHALGALRVTGIGGAAAGKIGLSANQLSFLGGSSGHGFFNSGGGINTSVSAAGLWTFTGSGTRVITITRPSADAGIQIGSTGGSGTAYGITATTSGDLSIQHDVDADPRIVLNGAANTLTLAATGGITASDPITPTRINSGSAQPGFLATRTSDLAGITSPTLIVFNAEVYDDAGNYSTGTGLFTAPVAGRYLLTATASVTETGGVQAGANVRIDTSNRSYGFGATLVVNGTATLGGSVVADMDAGDTAAITVLGPISGVRVNGNVTATIHSTFFSGRLLP